MTVRLYGAVAATVFGLCALVAFAFVALSPTSVAVQAPPDALLVSGLGGSDDGAQGSAPNRPPARVPTDESYAAFQASPLLAAPAPKAIPRSAPNAPPAAPSVEASLELSPVDTRPSAKLDDDVAKSPAVIPPPKTPPKPAPRVVDHRYDGVFTVVEIRRLKGAMRLSPDQEPYWGPVAALLRDIGRQQMALIDAGQKAGGLDGHEHDAALLLGRQSAPSSHLGRTRRPRSANELATWAWAPMHRTSRRL